MRGYNKDKVFAAQQSFKRNNGLNDDGSNKYRPGGTVTKAKRVSKNPNSTLVEGGIPGTDSYRNRRYIQTKEQAQQKANEGLGFITSLNPVGLFYNIAQMIDYYKGDVDAYGNNTNPNLITGTVPMISRGLNLKQVRSGIVTKNMLPTNRVYRITNMREVQDAKTIGQYRKLPGNITLPTKTVKSKSGRSFNFGKAGGNSHGGKAASMGEPWSGTTSAGIGDSRYIISTPSRHTTWQVGHHGRYSEPLPANAIKKGSGIWKKFDDNGNTGISTKRMTVYKPLGNNRYLRLSKNKYSLGGGLTSKDRGSSKHPYPNVASKDFAGGNRSYPIPTRADAVDALRLAGLHRRSDVRTKVYNKYPELRKKASIGTNIGINTNTNIPDYTNTYINWLISQLPSEKDKQQVTKFNQDDIDNAMNAANLAYQNYLIRQLPSNRDNKKESSKQNNNKPTKYMTADELRRNTQSMVDSGRRSVDFANNMYRSKLISQLQSEDKRSLKDKTQSMVDAANFAVNNAINYRNSKLISQLSTKKDSKQKVREKNKVVSRQVKTTPQYTGNVTKGNYQLHDGETKTINGVKYTRRGNTIINHKTNVGYIYDKNGNYTGQADYSKVGNFNQAFDAARAAGRSNFIYRAGKYQNYSTAKETDAKKEALNRRVGARRIAKRIGGFTNPPVGRPKAEDGMLAPIYSYGTNRRKYPSFANIDLTARAIPNFNPIAIPKYTANSDSSFNPSDYNYLGRQSSFKPAAQDYIGLGIDTLSALSGSLFSRNAYKNLNFDYALPNYVDETPVSFDTTYHNEAQRANVERNRLNSRNLISGNTASAQGALSRMQQTDTDAMMETNKLLDEKSNKEVELRNQNLANEQQVRARNAAARNQYYQNVASIKNAAIQAKNEAELSRARQLSVDLSGLSQAWNNFASSVENRYDSRQNEIAAISSANNPSVVKNAISLGYDLSPEVLANLYKNTNNNELKGAILGRLNQRDRRRYGIE